MNNNQNKVKNEMEIFITLTKYNTHQWQKKVTIACGDYLVSMFHPPHSSVQHIYEE